MTSAGIALYRFFDTADALLYVGISNCLPRRIDRHEDDKDWFTQVARVVVEWYPDRPRALAAERSAIHRERPRFNIVHNRDPRPAGAATTHTAASGAWIFENRRSGCEFTTDLWLYPEIDCSAMVDDYYDCHGEEQLEAYVDYIRSKQAPWWQADAVPIYWTVRGDGIFENAPFQHRPLGDEFDREDFLTFFSWPFSRPTGEMVDWYRLPVRNDRFPEFGRALGWLPSPFQATCPLRSLMYSRCGLRARPAVTA